MTPRPAAPTLDDSTLEAFRPRRNNGARDADEAAATVNGAWRYEEAFSRNLGLITAEEQQRLRNSRVAIAGMGGVGGIHLVTLARLGIGRFTIADPDVFEVANFNRQYGANIETLGRNKAEVMAEEVRRINPEVELTVLTEPVHASNAGKFLEGTDLYIDALEFFEIDARRALFRLAAKQGAYSITAGPVGFSAIWITFCPKGMTFDEYFDLSDTMDQLEKVVAFGVGVAPKATQRAYMDLTAINVSAHKAPSAGLACHLASGAMACESLRILLGKGRLYPAPYYHQFDVYLGRFVRGRLRRGNRNVAQRIKRWMLYRMYRNR